MYDMNNYDNDMAYSYDEYIEPKEEKECDCLTDREIEERLFENYEYESKMAEQIIDNLYNAKNSI